MIHLWLAYAVLSFGGFMSMGNKLILNVDKDAKWPDFADRTLGKGIYDYYGYDPYWKA